MKKYTTILAAVSAILFSATSCIGDLNVDPTDDDIVLPEMILTGVEQYEQVLAKCYVGLCTSGSTGESSSDIDGIDNGFGQYMRALFYLQEYTTDEALCTWNDGTVDKLHNLSWSRSDVYVRGMFSRCYYQISMCNELIRRAEVSEFKDDARIKKYIAEARGLRLLSYWHAVDMFGYKHIPFATEKNSVGSEGPAPSEDLIGWMNEEIEDLLQGNDLAEAGAGEYGRVDKGFVQMIKAKLNLNAPTYMGLTGGDAIPYFERCATACKAVMAAYPKLHENYAELFMADNHTRRDEIIFGVEAVFGDVQTWGTTQFIIFSTFESGDAVAGTALGVGDAGWGGSLVTPTFLAKFERNRDVRFMFWGGPSSYPETLESSTSFKSGWTSRKFTNISSDGNTNAGATFVDTDFPLFRSADAYLMLAESQLRGATNVSQSEAKAAWNAVRARAGLGEVQNYSLDELLDERGRELYWECFRRSDLVRFGKFTGSNYLWTWKGGEYNGKAVDDRFNVFPIPDAESNSNSKLGQNEGY